MKGIISKQFLTKMDRGITVFGTNRKVVMGISLLFIALSLILFIVALAGWTTDPNNLKSAGWAFSSKSDGATVYIGLQGFSTGGGSTTSYFSYTDSTACTGDNSYCSSCQNGGRAALGLILLSFFLTMGVFILTFLRMFKDTTGTKICAVCFLFFIWLFAVSGWGSWNSQCFNALSNSAATFSHMGGFGAAVAGWFFMWMIGFIHLLTPVDDGNAGSYGTGGGEGQTGGEKMGDASNA